MKRPIDYCPPECLDMSGFHCSHNLLVYDLNKDAANIKKSYVPIPEAEWNVFVASYRAKGDGVGFIKLPDQFYSIR